MIFYFVFDKAEDRFPQVTTMADGESVVSILELETEAEGGATTHFVQNPITTLQRASSHGQRFVPNDLVTIAAQQQRR